MEDESGSPAILSQAVFVFQHAPLASGCRIEVWW